MNRSIIFLLGITLFSSCEKNVIDYRNKYVGEYEFNVHMYSYKEFDEDWETTFVYLGEVRYDRKDKGKTIQVDYGDINESWDGFDVTMDISKSGEVSTSSGLYGSYANPDSVWWEFHYVPSPALISGRIVSGKKLD